MSTRRVAFFIFLIVVLVGVFIIIAPSISQMNTNANAINQAVDAQRTQNSFR